MFTCACSDAEDSNQCHFAVASRLRVFACLLLSVLITACACSWLRTQLTSRKLSWQTPQNPTCLSTPRAPTLALARTRPSGEACAALPQRCILTVALLVLSLLTVTRTTLVHIVHIVYGRLVVMQMRLLLPISALYVRITSLICHVLYSPSAKCCSAVCMWVYNDHRMISCLPLQHNGIASYVAVVTSFLQKSTEFHALQYNKELLVLHPCFAHPAYIHCNACCSHLA